MKKNIIYIGYWLLVIGFICVSCGPEARLDMVGMFAGTSPTIDERFTESKV